MRKCVCTFVHTNTYVLVHIYVHVCTGWMGSKIGRLPGGLLSGCPVLVTKEAPLGHCSVCCSFIPGEFRGGAKALGLHFFCLEQVMEERGRCGCVGQ